MRVRRLEGKAWEIKQTSDLPHSNFPGARLLRSTWGQVVLKLYVCSSLQLCLTLCNPMDCSPPGFSDHGILQARILEWVAIPFFGRYFWLRLNPGHLLCRQILYHLNHRRHTSVQSVQFSCSVLSDSLRPHESQHTRPLCPLPTPRVYSNSYPSSQWCHWAISSSVVPFSSCPQSLPASGSFPMSQLFTWGGQSTRVSASASVLPMNTQDWSPLGWTGWISLQSKGLSRVFSNTTVQKDQFFGTHLSL